MRKYRFEVIIFIADAICMILELVASRIISPYFGNSNLVWTSVIGIILLSGSIGNYIGGIIADRKDINKNLKIILIIAAIFVFIIPILQKDILELIIHITSSIKIGAILATLSLFFIPSVLMGLLTPIIIKLKLNDLDTAGKASGKITSIATIGGIFGTFLGGFYLVPNFGSVQILFFLTIILLCLVLLVDLKLKERSNISIIIMIIISIFFMEYYINKNNEKGEEILNGEETDYVSYDTQYGRVLIYNREINKEKVRVLNIDNGYESATFTDENKVNELVFDYTKYYDLMFQSDIDINNVLLIGRSRIFLS